MVFWKTIFKKSTLFIILMVLSTFGLSFTAAYYSVYGLSSLFAGSQIEVIIMASTLEFSKLVIASYLHNHWKRIGVFLKTYLTLGVVILMLITSAGVYGFLTSAYQSTAFEMDIFNNKVELLETKKDRFITESNRYTIDRNNISNSINELTKGLSNNVIQYKDDDTGKIITTTSSATRSVLNTQLNVSQINYDKLSDKINTLNDSITKYELRIMSVKSESTISSELGPLLYLTELTGKPMNEVVNWFTLLIVIVFDPLAIAMVIALNKYVSYVSNNEDNTKVDIVPQKTKLINSDKTSIRKRKRK